MALIRRYRFSSLLGDNMLRNRIRYLLLIVLLSPTHMFAFSSETHLGVGDTILDRDGAGSGF